MTQPARKYDRYLESDSWHDKRRCALARANYMCQVCILRPATEIHHVTYVRVYDERAEDLLPVCRQCHEWMHQQQQRQRVAANDNVAEQLLLPLDAR